MSHPCPICGLESGTNSECGRCSSLRVTRDALATTVPPFRIEDFISWPAYHPLDELAVEQGVRLLRGPRLT